MMFLLIVTLSSMLLAAIMSLVAWRMAAEERRRSEARVAALAAEIHAPIASASSGQQPTAYRASSSRRSTETIAQPWEETRTSGCRTSRIPDSTP